MLNIRLFQQNISNVGMYYELICENSFPTMFSYYVYLCSYFKILSNYVGIFLVRIFHSIYRNKIFLKCENILDKI